MMFPQLIKHLALIGLALILLVGIQCRANDEGDDNLSKLQEQIELKDPYQVLSDYLVNKRLSNDFEGNQKVVKELADEVDFERSIESEEFKGMVQLVISLRTTSGEYCELANLANLRQMTAKMKQYNVQPTVGRESRYRLNRLLIEYSDRVYFKCVDSLQSDWSLVDFNMVLLDDTSRLALATLEAEVDFVQLIRSDYNPNLANEFQLAQSVQCVLDHLHMKRTGELVKRDREELIRLMNFYLIDSCQRLKHRLGLAQSSQQAEIVQKYLDLITVAILMYPQVLTAEDERQDFREIRVKGAGRVVVCNKLLLSDTGNEALADKMLSLAKSPVKPSNSKQATCKLL